MGTGKEFEIVAGYSDPVNAHRVLSNAWVGTTTFFEKEIVVEKANLQEAQSRVSWADIASNEEVQPQA